MPVNFVSPFPAEWPLPLYLFSLHLLKRVPDQALLPDPMHRNLPSLILINKQVPGHFLPYLKKELYFLLAFVIKFYALVKLSTLISRGGAICRSMFSVDYCLEKGSQVKRVITWEAARIMYEKGASECRYAKRKATVNSAREKPSPPAFISLPMPGSMACCNGLSASARRSCCRSGFFV
jgi:hypothetical protein